jgi:hypothetical protein
MSSASNLPEAFKSLILSRTIPPLQLPFIARDSTAIHLAQSIPAKYCRG